MIKMNFLGDRDPSEARKEQKDAAIKFAAALDTIDVYSVKSFTDLVAKLKSKPDIEVHHVKPSGDKKGKILSASGIAITGLMKFLVNEQAHASKNGPFGSPEREQMYNELCKLFGVTRGKGGRVIPENMRAHFRDVEEGYTGLGDYLERVYKARYRGVEVHDKDKHNEYTWVSGPFVHVRPCEAMAAFLKKIYDKFVIGDNDDLVCTYDPEEVGFYKGNSRLVKMTVEDGIKAIVDDSFCGCIGLESVDLPDSLQTIGKNAFCNCPRIKSIEIPKSVTSIGEGAFNGCRTLASITIPEGVTGIRRFTFNRCKKLKSIKIPQSIIGIGEGAFCECENLKSITIPPSVMSIGRIAFLCCGKLESITIPPDVISIEEGAFSGCTKLESITMPPDVESIKRGAFRGCRNLKSITIPPSVTSIGDSAFERCIKLESITMPQGIISIGVGAFGGCNKLKSITIPDSIEFIEPYAFAGIDPSATINGIPYLEWLKEFNDKH